MSDYPKNVKEVIGGASNGQEILVIDETGDKWKAPKELVEYVKMGIETLAFSKVLKEVGASQELVEDYPETPNLFDYLLSENNTWIKERLKEEFDEETIRKELREKFYRFALEGATDVESIKKEIEKVDYSNYRWDKIGGKV